MKQKILLSAFIVMLSCIMVSDLNAQMRFGFGPRIGGRYYTRPYTQHKPNNNNTTQNTVEKLPRFVPTVNLSIGYGFPYLDKYLLPDLQGLKKGDYEQSGTINAAIDYQFSRFTSIGVMGFYGKTSVPYYAQNALSSDPPIYNGSLEGWAVMINMVNYFAPVDQAKVNGYIRTALGVNVWNQKFTDNNGIKQNNIATNPSEFAYQVSLGADFNLSPRATIFIEGGYGKYILNGGFKVKF